MNGNDDEKKSALQTAAAHLVELAASKQLVFLGDQAGISEHVSFVAQILPDLYQGGVRNLAWEFSNSRAQGELDELLSNDEWSERKCTDLFIDLLGVGFTYSEYADVLKAAWSLNRSLPSESSPFRVVGLGIPSYVEDPRLLEGRSAAELELRNWWMGGLYRDVTAFHMANTLTNEVIRQGQRALVWVSGERSTTRLVEWESGVPTVTVGNLLHRWMGEGVARAVFHGAIKDSSAAQRVEELVAASPEQPNDFGINLNLATLGNVGLSEIAGSISGIDSSLRLRDVADSYLWLGGVETWSPCKLLDDVVTEQNYEVLQARHQALEPRDEPWSRAELEEIRQEGQRQIAASWISLPTPEEETPKRNIFRRRRA